MKRWTRRSLLVGGVAVALPLAGLGAGKLWCHMSGLPSLRPRLPLLLSLYPASAAMRALGKQYLQQTKSTATASLRRIERHDNVARAADSGCGVATMAALEQACRDDFRAGRTHCIDSWVLAETELDMAALCAAMPGSNT